MTFAFPMVTNDLFELKTPEWLDDNYYSLGHIMTAICARLANNGVHGPDAMPFINDMWADIQGMAIETYRSRVLCGVYVCVYRMPSGNLYELVAYKSL